MALKDYEITPTQIATYGVVSARDKLEGTAQENKAVFDKLVKEVVAPAFNNLLTALVAQTGASEIGASVTDIEGSNVQAILAGLKAHVDKIALDAGSVTSVFGRAGVVQAQSGDYTAAMVGATPTTYAATVTNDTAWTEESDGVFVQTLTHAKITAKTRIDVLPSPELLAQMKEDGVEAIYARNNNGTAALVCLNSGLSKAVSIEINFVEVENA